MELPARKRMTGEDYLPRYLDFFSAWLVSVWSYPVLSCTTVMDDAETPVFIVFRHFQSCFMKKAFTLFLLLIAISFHAFAAARYKPAFYDRAMSAIHTP